MSALLLPLSACLLLALGHCVLIVVFAIDDYVRKVVASTLFSFGLAFEAAGFVVALAALGVWALG